MIPMLRRFFRRLYRNRTLRATPDGVKFIMISIGIGVAAINTGNNLLYLILGMALSLITVSGILSEYDLRKIDVQIHFPEHIFAEQSFPVQYRIHNGKKILPVFSLLIQLKIQEELLGRPVHSFAIRPGQSGVQSDALLFHRRGLYPIDGVTLSTRFPFGLFEKGLWKEKKLPLLVFPAVRPVPERILHHLSIAGDDNGLSRRGEGPTLYNIREYQSGDDARSIHWKISAKSPELMVRENERDDERRVTLVLSNYLPGSDPGPQLKNFERAVTLTASLADYFLRKGMRVRLLTATGEVPFGSGAGHVTPILRALALVKAVPLYEGSTRPSPGHWSWDDGGRITIVPWEDPSWYGEPSGDSTVVHPALLAELFGGGAA
jgi:uncharacterized protein (DUF58 family)